MNNEKTIQYAIGDIVLAPFPFADHTITKLRPAILVSVLPKDAWLVIYITSSLETVTDFDVLLEPSSINNLKLTSIARVNRMTPISNAMIDRQLGKLSKNEKNKIGKKLALLKTEFVRQ